MAMYIFFLVLGPIWDAHGVPLTMYLSAFTFTLGFLLMHLATANILPATLQSAPAVACYYFLVGCGSCASFMACVGACMANYPPSRAGLLSAFLGTFYALSGTLHVKAYGVVTACGGGLAEFLLTLAILSGVVNIFGAVAMEKVGVAEVGLVVLGPAVGESVVKPVAVTLDESPVEPQELTVAPAAEPSLTLGHEAWEDAATAAIHSQGVAVMVAKLPVGIEVIDRLNAEGTPMLPSGLKVGEVTIDCIPLQEDQAGDERVSLLGVVTVPEELASAVIVVAEKRDMTPREILASGIFWLVACSFIWQQGLTYFNNIGTMVKELSPPSTPPSTIASATSFHVTLLSVSNCLARIVVGAGSDVLVASLAVDRSALLLAGQLVGSAPVLLMATADEVSATGLTVASLATGFSIGATSGIFPPLAADFFGMTHYGTACAFLMCGIPIGIVVSNGAFGVLFDGAVVAGCAGAGCFRSSFVVFSALQVVAVVTAAWLFALRAWRR
ncbi:hypothetical protein HK101_010363 [Irineochytrium annulatum]|nr:hypothetical protein HK101_010363 [Irineochytrium annulatum]